MADELNNLPVVVEESREAAAAAQAANDPDAANAAYARELVALSEQPSDAPSSETAPSETAVVPTGPPAVSSDLVEGVFGALAEYEPEQVDELRRLQAASEKVLQHTPPGRLGLPAHLLHAKQDLLAVPADADHHQRRDRCHPPVEARLDAGAVQDQPHHVLARQVPRLPGLPIGLRLAPGAAHRVLADLSPEQAGQRPADTARIGAGKVGIGDDRLGAPGQPLVGLDGLAPPFLLTAVPVEQADAGKRHRQRSEGADKPPLPVAVAIALGRAVASIALAAAQRRLRFLQGIEPIVTGKWNGRRRRCKMFHGVSSFRRSHTAGLNVLQSGAYAGSPIFHQPCDTTRSSAETAFA